MGRSKEARRHKNRTDKLREKERKKKRAEESKAASKGSARVLKNAKLPHMRTQAYDSNGKKIRYPPCWICKWRHDSKKTRCNPKRKDKRKKAQSGAADANIKEEAKTEEVTV